MSQGDERRWHHRRSSVFSAQIWLSDQSPAISCKVQNLSSGGAQLTFASIVELPPEFFLEVATLDLRVKARVVWSLGEQHGIMFVWPQHKERGKRVSV